MISSKALKMNGFCLVVAASREATKTAVDLFESMILRYHTSNCAKHTAAADFGRLARPGTASFIVVPPQKQSGQ